MHTLINNIILLILINCCIACSNESSNKDKASTDFNISAQSQQHEFTVQFTAKNQAKLPVGEFHQWVVTLKDKAGKPIYPAKFAISGGMPAHGHGLPTTLRVTQYLGNGQYLMEGVKFSMDGHWVIQLNIVTQSTKDIAKIEFDVHY